MQTWNTAGGLASIVRLRFTGVFAPIPPELHVLEESWGSSRIHWVSLVPAPGTPT